MEVDVRYRWQERGSGPAMTTKNGEGWGGGHTSVGEGCFSVGKKRWNLPVSRAKEVGIPKKL